MRAKTRGEISRYRIFFIVTLFGLLVWIYFQTGFFAKQHDTQAVLLHVAVIVAVLTLASFFFGRLQLKYAVTISKYLYILPALALITGIIYWPILNTFAISFTDQVGLKGGEFAGFLNYIELFQNKTFYKILLQTFYWTGGIVFFTIIISLYSAQIMNREFYGQKLLRVLFILPWATSMVVTAVTYQLILNGDFGYLNKILFELNKNYQIITWLGNKKTVMPSLIFIGIMVSIPFSTITFLAAMHNVPAELYEAAELDGANSLQKFFKITMPQIRNVTTVVVILNLIYVFNSFPIIWVLTKGGPVDRSHIMVTYLYEKAFFKMEFGSASAMAVIIFFVVFTLSILYVFTVERE